MPLRDLPYNLNLVDGPDCSGTRSAAYMSALARYQGRFYSEFGEPGRRRIESTGHHVLILSGLYGLLRPLERIQAYSCHLLDHPSIPDLWKVDGFLTGLFLDYIRTYGVRRVFDLSGQKVYRDLIHWPRVRERVEVLHAFGDQNAGPAVLPALAQILASLVEAPEQEQLGIAPGRRLQTDFEDVSLEPLPQPPHGFPAEEKGVRPAGDQAPVSVGSPPVVEPTRAEPVLDHARDIPISGRDHRTMFGRKIHSMRDLPAEARCIFELVSSSPEVLEVHLGQFGTSGARAARSFTLSLSMPREGMGVIPGRIHGPGSIGRWQKIEIRVTRGRETATYLLLKKLLDDRGSS